MKKLLFVLFCLLFIPVVFAKENVSIEKIELVSKDDNVVENSEPIFKGLEMNYDIAFKKVNDAIKYKVTIKNDTGNDYKISSETSFSKSNYLKYEYEVTDILKANSSMDVLVTITYNKEIEDSDFVNERYDETNKAVVKLLTLDDKEVNPKTSSGLLLILLLVISFVLYMGIVLLVSKKSMVRYVPILIMGGMLLIPIVSKALEELRITVNVKVEVLKTYKIGFVISNEKIYPKEEAEKLMANNSDAYCDDVLYVGSVSEENKYYLCVNHYIYEGPVRYYAGEKAVVPKLEEEVTDCKEEPYEDDEGNIICSGLETKTVEIYQDMPWAYSFEPGSFLEYETFENDYEVMKFKDENGILLDKNGSIDNVIVRSGYKFTMPKHNVLFYIEMV